MRQVAHPYELRTDRRFTPRGVRALPRGGTGDVPADGRVRFQAADQDAASDGTPAQALGRRPGLADLRVLAPVPHALPPRRELAAA